ncbi:MAG: Gfo/Idh/MocA family oxidoreductase [Spirochaetaceae bacterium]|nr:MAG: Gfo/Idh/MocA family oxidoreductase [Spirochaetaceae bacterium]
MKDVKVAIVGSGGIANIYAIALKTISAVDIVACASPTEEHIASFASRFDIPRRFTEYRKMLEMDAIDLVVIGTPNHLHAQITVEAASAGKHVVCVKPLCMNLFEADEMIEACRRANVRLMYGENICFEPKYVKLKEICDSGALGDVFLLKQSSKHGGPPTEWFWDLSKSGGWATMDLGCHALQFFRWICKNEEPESIFAEMANCVHAREQRGDDESIIIVNFRNGLRAITETSWAKKGGFEDKAEAYGTKGVSYAYMPMGMTLDTYSEIGYQKKHYVSENVPPGWTYATYEEEWHYGFPQMFRHFTDCILNDTDPVVTGEDGRKVMEMMLAAYESANKGCKVYFPFEKEVEKPIDLWLHNK